MKRALIVISLLLLASLHALAQDPVKVAPNQCKVVLENDYVRVLHWTVGSHGKTDMHDHPALVTISLSGGKSRYTAPDGKTRDLQSKAGQVTWSDPDKHSSENLSDNTGDLIQVELKKKPAAEMTAIPASEDSVTVDPKHYHLEFENDRVRVLRISYGPGEKSVMHSHPANVAVFLADGKTKMTLPDGKSSVAASKAGQVLWTAAKETHLPENAGGKPSEVILIELR